MMSSITVTKSSPVLVGPSSVNQSAKMEHYTNLSPFDKPLAFFPMMSFHVFTNNDRAAIVPDPAETVRRALSDALVHYYPVAGRLGADLRIACTGEGVAFVAAKANCSLEDVKLLDPPFGSTLLSDLAVGLGGAGEVFRPSDPLLLIQVTEFTCGGFVVGVTRNHAIADGTGFAQFLQAVGDLARGMPQLTVLPVTCGDDSLPELPPLVKALGDSLVGLELQHDLAYLDITVPSRCVNRIKAGFAAGSEDDKEPCTVLEAVMAVLWQCRTRVVMPLLSNSDEAPAPLMFPVNVRKLVGAKPGYYGNCITSALAVPRAGEVANGDINDVVKLIKRAKKQALSAYSHHHHQSNNGMEMEQQLDDRLLGYNAFVITSWRNLGSGAVDLGGGTPARVMCRLDRSALPNCVACLPCKAKDGANVLATCVKHEHVQAFLEELAKFIM